MSYNLPLCPTGCETEPAPVQFDNCNPELHYGPVEWLYLRKRGESFIDWTSAAEWTANINNSTSNPNDIRELRGIGSLAEAAANVIKISGNRSASGPKVFTISFAIDETNLINYEWLRSNECNGNYNVWFETSSASGNAGLLFGDNDGIRGYVNANLVIETDESAPHKYMLTITWEAKFHPKMIVSPIAHA